MHIDEQQQQHQRTNERNKKIDWKSKTVMASQMLGIDRFHTPLLWHIERYRV